MIQSYKLFLLYGNLFKPKSFIHGKLQVIFALSKTCVGRFFWVRLDTVSRLAQMIFSYIWISDSKSLLNNSKCIASGLVQRCDSTGTRVCEIKFCGEISGKIYREIRISQPVFTKQIKQLLCFNKLACKENSISTDLLGYIVQAPR